MATKGLARHEDAYGRAMLEHFESGGRARDVPIIERDDGLITPDPDVGAYFREFRNWPTVERKVMRHVQGRVLDVGAGAGRHALELQRRGHEVVAIDNSPLAAQVSRRRGVKDARVVPFTHVSRKLGVFDTVLMFGNNVGLFGGPGRARWMLRKLKRMTSDGARIVGTTLDPYNTDVPEHLAYHRRNRKRGRMAGQLRIRVRYVTLATPWFDYLVVSPGELRDIVDGTGWRLERVAGKSKDSAFYAVVIEKE